MTVRIVTDSSCDLAPEVISEHGITVVPLYVNFADRSYRDGVDLTRADFYARLPSAKPPPTTAAPGSETFREVYQRLIDGGAGGVLSIHIGSTLSNVFEVAKTAAAGMRGAPVRAFDGGQITLGTGLQVLHAARLAARGADLDEIIVSLQQLAARIHSFAALETLEFLRRGGRVNLVMFSLGTILQLKPILKMHAGKVLTDRARTSSGAVARLVDLARGLGRLEGVALVHAGAPERLVLLRSEVESKLPGVPILLEGEVAPVIGAHVGPGAVGIVCVQALTA